MRAHIRIERHALPEAKPHIVVADRVVAVGEDGSEIDLSTGVVEWSERSEVGEARKATVTLLVYEVVDT